MKKLKQMLTRRKRLRLRKSKDIVITLPNSKQVENELNRIKQNIKVNNVIKGSLCFLIVVTALSVLLTNYFMPIFRIYGNSMEPNLTSGEIVVAVKTNNLKQGDIVAFTYNNKILIKRYIAGAGDIVDIDDNGIVYINGVKLNEPYIDKFDLGNTDIEFPYQVPESRIFVMGDNREVSLDSRSSQVGCIYEEQIKGKIIFRFWPLGKMKFLNFSSYQ